LIFVTLGSQKFQFNRLLKYIDQLIEENIIKEKVFAQIGYSDYIPKNFGYKNFLSREEFVSQMVVCSKVITHGGTGAIVTALKNEKKVIAMARIAKFGEHVDDHQLQIVEEFRKLNFILSISFKEEIVGALELIDEVKLETYLSSTKQVIASIDNFIENI